MAGEFSKLLSTTAVALILSATASIAADEGVKDWSGAYFGAKFGYGFGEMRGSGAGFSASGNVDGVIGGLMGGYNFQAGSFVFGLDTDTSFTSIEGTSNAGPCAGLNCQGDIEWLSTYRGRLGFSAGDVMPFITGGLATGLVGASGGPVHLKSKLHTGFTFGGGVDWAINDMLNARLEYSYVDLGSRNHGLGIGLKVHADELHLIRAGISVNTHPFLALFFNR